MFARSALAALLAVAAPAAAVELVDLKLDSKPRKYGPKNPVQAEKQDFALSDPGVLTLVHVIDPVHKDARGGFTLDEVNLRNFTVGRGIFQERVPDTAVPGQMRRFTQKWLCPPRTDPLRLRAALVAPHRPDGSDQLGASQRLLVTFVPFDKVSGEPGPAAEVDVAGRWYHGEANAVWTFTPKGDGTYAAAEKGYDNATGTARVKGRTIFIDYVTTTAKGKQVRGVAVVEVKPDGTHADGWSVGEGGAGGERWSAAPGTAAKPLPKTAP